MPKGTSRQVKPKPKHTKAKHRLAAVRKTASR